MLTGPDLGYLSSSINAVIMYFASGRALVFTEPSLLRQYDLSPKPSVRSGEHCIIFSGSTLLNPFTTSQNKHRSYALG